MKGATYSLQVNIIGLLLLAYFLIHTQDKEIEILFYLYILYNLIILYLYV